MRHHVFSLRKRYCVAPKGLDRGLRL